VESAVIGKIAAPDITRCPRHDRMQWLACGLVAIAAPARVRSKSVTENNVPAGWYAVMQFGGYRYETYGHNYYVYGNCTIGSSTYQYTKVPRKNVTGAAGAQNTTGAIPWDHV
jgi:DNA gyrase inhibitor GyrI